MSERHQPEGFSPVPAPTAAPSDGRDDVGSGDLIDPANATRLAWTPEALYFTDAGARDWTIWTLPTAGGERREVWRGVAIEDLVGNEAGVAWTSYDPDEAPLVRHLLFATHAQALAATAPAELASLPAGSRLAAEGDTVFWSSGSRLFRASSPALEPVELANVPGVIEALTAQGDWLYWLERTPLGAPPADLLERLHADDAAPASLRRVPAIGGTPTTLCGGLSRGSFSFAASGDEVFVVRGVGERAVVERVPAGGGPAARLLETATPSSTVAADARYVYWIDDGGLGKTWLRILRLARAPGASPEPWIVDPRMTAAFLVVRGDTVYWSSFEGVKRRRF